MPRVFRAMKRLPDGRPELGVSATTLGVRVGADLDIDNKNNVVINHKGMSVSPTWRQLPIGFRPRRPGFGGLGRDSLSCFRLGDGPFEQDIVVPGLELLPDSPTHGVLRPTDVVPLTEHERTVAATQSLWSIDES